MWKWNVIEIPRPERRESKTLEAVPTAASDPVGTVVRTGSTVSIKGEITGAEDLTVDGQVEGRIDLSQHVLTIGPRGRVTAEVVARSVVVQGQVVGNITASERIEIREHGSWGRISFSSR